MVTTLLFNRDNQCAGYLTHLSNKYNVRQPIDNDAALGTVYKKVLIVRNRQPAVGCDRLRADK